MANAIHLSMYRRQGPFIAVNVGNCLILFIESELFGYKAGSFLLALASKVSRTK